MANHIEKLEVQNGGTVNIHESPHIIPKALTTKLGKSTIIGREKELDEIDNLLKTNNSLLLINGIGGVGKSTIASFYLHSHKEQFDYYGFFEGLESFVVELKASLNLKSEKSDELFMEALARLKGLDGEKLLVLDDVKMIEENKESIEKILALKDNGYKILLTSREEIEDIEQYYLDVLSIEDAKKLFNSIYKVEDEQLLEEVLEYLDCYAFFVEKLALTLKLRKNTLSLEDIKEKFKNREFSKIRIKSKKNQKEEENIGKLLDELFTFDDLDDEDILLLKQLSMLPSIEIPYRQLEIFLSKKDDEDFEDLLNFIVSKGWLYGHDNSYKLHQIIREYIWEKHTPKVEEIDSIVLFFANMIKKNNIQTAKLLQGYIVYFEEIIYVLGRLGVKFNENIVEFFDNLGKVYYYLGEYKKAQPFWYKVLEIREKVLGEEHPDTASSYNNLALLYKSMGAYEKAEPLYKKALKISENVLGEEHPSTATSYNNLAGLYRSMGAYEKAEPLYEKSLKIYEKVLGEEHPSTATSYNNLAELYRSMGAYEKVEPLYKKALKIKEKVLGEEHPSTANSYNNLAVLYESMGAYEKAEPLYEKSLKIREKVLGEEHPDTDRSYNDLAIFYYGQGDYEFMKRAVEVWSKVLPEGHPNLVDAKKVLEIIEGRL